MSRGDALTAAVQATDLPALIAEFQPDSKAMPGKAGVYFASWRGNTDSPALSVSRKGQTWLWKDHATGDGGNAFDFMVQVEGMGRQEAAHFLLQRAGIPDEPPSGEAMYRPIPEEAQRQLLGRQSVPMKAMAGRGFNKRLLETYGIVADGQDALIPITSPHGVVLQVKRRLADATKMKYRYEHKGHSGPPWCSLGAHDASILFIVEGELNGMIAHASMVEAGETSIGVMGVAGAENALYDGLCSGKVVFIYADDDEPGKAAVARWQEEAREQGARSVHRLPPQPVDFCDYAGRNGRTALAELLGSLRRSAVQVYGLEDRLVGTMSVRQLIDSAKRYISGEIIHPTGFSKIDEETGGVRESGLFGVGGLSSMGKSAFMRRILIEEVRAGGTVRLYSPDQGPQAVYRLLASLLSDVGAKEARTGRFDPSVLKRYGSPEAAIQSWKKAYQHVVVEIAPRFQVTGEGEVREILKDMERAVDQGVTMFGVDYIQMLEPEGSDNRDGMAAHQLEKAAQHLNKPMVVAMQLAKYKFPPTRRNALPTAGDIQGAGAYFHSCEMIFMVFNDYIYRNKYAGPEYEPYYDPPDAARVALRKDKEGEGDLDFEVRWIPRLATFKDPARMALTDEHIGLI